MRKLFVAFLLSGFSLSASAALVDMGSYTQDTNQGIDWLDLSVTGGLSVSDALTANAGWRYATESEVDGLFAQAFANYAPNLPEGVANTDSPGAYAEIGAEVLAFQDLFGIRSNGNQSVLYTYSLGWYKDDADIWRTMGGTTYQELVDGEFVYDRFRVFGADYTGDFTIAATNGSFAYGTYLVRSSVVPIPAAGWLFVSALAGLGWLRRRQLA